MEPPIARRPVARHPTLRLCLLVVGCLFLIVTPFVGILPGPGGVFTFAIGMGLVLKNSLWAKRRYARFKRRWPRPGHWADWGMRRPSARRRAAIAAKREGPAD